MRYVDVCGFSKAALALMVTAAMVMLASMSTEPIIAVYIQQMHVGKAHVSRYAAVDTISPSNVLSPRLPIDEVTHRTAYHNGYQRVDRNEHYGDAS
ncbi:MAG: hypothetical protein ABW193_02615 [Luteibacter sp.]